MSEDAAYYRRKLDVASERDLDSLNSIHPGVGQAESLDSAPCDRMASPNGSGHGLGGRNTDQVPMEELTTRQAQRRHQMSQWGIEFQPTFSDGQWARRSESAEERVQASGSGQGVAGPPEVTDHPDMTAQGDSPASRTPRYTSHHTNYQDMLDSMSPTDPFQGEYIPSGKKKLVSLNTPPSRVKHLASKDKKGLGTRSRTQISADDGDNDNPVLRRSQSNVETGERKSKRKKKKQTKNVLLNSTDVSTGTYTLEEPGSYYNVALESDNTAKPSSGARHRKRKKPKHHTESPGEKGDNVDGESVKSNGTYTVPRSDSQTGLLNFSSMSRLSNLWRKKKRQSKRELARMNTGLSAVKSGHSQKALANFITANFMQSECNHYVNSTDGTCKCGRPLQWHQDKGLPISMDNIKDFWHPQTHTEKIPCDSFGEICFQGFGNESKDSPYLRLDPTSDLDKVWTLLTDYWLLPYPTLLISVTGGAQKLHLKPRMEALFQHGLIHAATSTGAWIITGGTNAGVMKCVGEAVKDYLLTADTSEQAKLVSLGIATWGIVANKDALDGEGDRGLFPAVYNVESVRVRGRLAPLDHNHTHFLLLDNGTEMKYGQEIQFRSEFEDYISKRVETGVAEGQSVNVPVVLLVLEGGQGTLRTVWESVSRRTPVVVIQSSGRAADIIAHTFKITRHPSNEDVSLFPSTFDTIALNMTKKDFVWGNRDEASIDREAAECVKQLREILQQRHLINVFNIDDADTKDIDKCILFALLKANKTNPQSQLALALAWNRSDLARQKIFTRENHVFWQKLDLYDAMFTALVQDRVEFVQLFIDHGVDLKRLNVLTLWNLYANAVQEPPNNCAQQFTHWISDFNQSWGDYLCCRPTDHGQFGEDLLSRVGRVFQQLLGEQASNIYGGEKFKTSTSSGLPSLKWEGRKTADCADGVVMSRPRHKHHKHRTGKKKMVQDFQFPERELFIWAVLLNRRRLANMFWKIGRDHIGGALMGATLLKAMSKAADDDEEMELAADLMDHSNHFEALAVAVLSECYNKDKRMAHMLLVRELDSWGKTTLFSLADAGTLMDFMEHTSCQTKLNIIWKGCMAQYTSSLKIILALFLPVFVPAIKFTNNTSPVEDLDGDDDVPEEEPQEEVITPVTQVTQPNTPTHDKRLPSANKISPGDSNLEEVEFARSKSRRTQKTRKKFFHVAMPGGDDGERNAINIVSAIYFFYTAPVTKFYCNLVSYLTFLGIFSFFVLTDLRPVTMANSPSLLEYITWGWSATLAIEEIRQIFTRDPRSLKYKLSSWFSSEWNRLDLTMYFFLIVSIILRLTLWGSNFYWARVTYTITITLFFIRTMQYFYVNKNMGPKVIMIKKMLTDLMFFFFILVVFVVSFGVAYTVNRFPNSQLSWDVLKHVVYLPYWQMYGELFLEDVEGDMPEGSCSYNASVYLGDEDMDRCPEKTWLVPILAALYMLLTNILLVNLLIAMFSYTFERVQENSEKVWRFYRYSLIYEYYDRPTFVPPLIIITHIFRAVKYFIQLKSGSNHKADAFRRILAPDESQRYTALEKAAMEKYATKALLFERGKMDFKVQSTADRLDQVMAELESIKEQVLQDSVEKEAIEPLHTPPLQAQPVSDPGRVRDDMGKLNRRLNHVTDQLTMQSERLDSVLTLLVSMSQRPVGQSNVSPTGSTGVVLPAPQPSQLDSVHIHHLPGSTDEI